MLQPGEPALRTRGSTLRLAMAWALGVIGGALALEALREMATGPAALRLGGLVLPPGRIQLEWALAATLATGAVLLGRWPPRPERLPPIVGALCFAALLANTRMIGSGDTLPAAYLPFAIVRDHALTLERARSLFEAGGGLPYFLHRVDGRIVSQYPLTTGFLALPAYVPAVFGAWNPTTAGTNDLEKIAAALLTAIGVGFLFDAMRRVAGVRAALLAIPVYVLGTEVLTILGQALWQHTGAAFSLSVAVWALFSIRDVRTRAVVVGFFASLALACRPIDVILASALGYAVVRLDRRSLVPGLIAAILPVALVAAYNAWAFGRPWRTGYGGAAWSFWTEFWPTGLGGLLVSPARGLVVTAPVVVFGAIGLAVGASEGWRPAARPLLIGVGIYVAVLAKRVWWDGAFCAGPRMLSDTLPYLGIGLSLALAPLRSWPWKAAFLAAAVASVTTHALLAYVPPPPLTKRLVWDLSEGAWSPKAYPPVAYVLGVRARQGSR